MGQTKKKNEKDREDTFGRARANHCVMAGFKSVHTQSVMFHDAPWPLWLNLKNKKSEHEQLSQFYLKNCSHLVFNATGLLVYKYHHKV